MAGERGETRSRGTVTSLLRHAYSRIRPEPPLWVREGTHDVFGQLQRVAAAERSAAWSPPTAWFICPHNDAPSGGVRKLYHCVDTLNAAGLNAAILHAVPGFRCRWFENTTRIVSANEITLGSRDIFVVPEVYGQSICDLPPNTRQIIFNQNVYLTLKSMEDAPANAAPYKNNRDLLMVLVVSQDNAEVLKRTFPETLVRRLRLGIDPGLHHPPQVSKRRRLVYMPRKRAKDAAAVLGQLKLRGVLNGWDIVAIDGRSETETAELLRSAKLFLSFSFREGFGLPPLEALACGCIVVGYHGSGGREYFEPPFAIAVEDGDVAAFVRTVEATIQNMDADPQRTDSLAAAASHFAYERYPADAEKLDLLNIFGPLLQQ